jgi:hypothetical protein
MERTKGTTDLEVHLTTHLWIKDRDIKIGSDRRGRKAHWTQVEACTVTVVNEDGSNTVYKVKQVPRSPSHVPELLKRINNKIVRNRG